MKTIMVMAESLNGVIGNNGQLPWKCPEDMKYFKELTTGHCVIMGRNTFGSIGSKPLKNRHNFVISKTLPQSDDPNVSVYSNPRNAHKMALSYCVDHGCHVFIIGGREIYDYFLENDLIDDVYISVINRIVVGDTLAPVLPSSFRCFKKVLSSISFDVYKYTNTA